MSYWSHNPELYDEIIFKQMVAEGLANEDCEDFGEVVRIFIRDNPKSWETICRAEQNYWGSKIDEVMTRKKEG
jgi:hypothetical protein